MTLDPEDIERWSEPPGEFMRSWTDEVLHDALRRSRLLRERGYVFGSGSSGRPPAEKEFEVFRQGSYANGTTISGASDVDLVIQLKVPFEENVVALTRPELQNFDDRYADTLLTWEVFRRDVLAGISERYWVDPGNKCFAISDWDSLVRVPADILPAMEFRLYEAFPVPGVEIYEEGVFFRDKFGHPIVNFPKQHLRNGTIKNRWTGGRFKEMVRVVKHACRRAVERDGLDPENVAPSYFIECLLYNVPDDEYRTSRPEAFANVVRWLNRWPAENRDDFERQLCQNELVPMFGTGPDHWETGPAEKFIDTLNKL
ncbi:nucleotidyltransferase [Actinoplanes ianthinogenes]|uniref:Nucleotidyltransferase n=1 Tax=Actinoplanes ianthinogenes TaxID=122358 RepID=A0ABM7LLA7_9ACTN|nr:nucleotidyltransferase domain-containing protein [Actinoplanes ianthinogenes]BCJ40057.1 nucleotidyltransferase [Actinoplanes ianthinogenes]GGR09983.1 nucleotidyltransferase [Actinoplanes ianthinogenes]